GDELILRSIRAQGEGLLIMEGFCCHFISGLDSIAKLIKIFEMAEYSVLLFIGESEIFRYEADSVV
ncbi:MAG: hypothetical protein K2H21_01150, partial [Muribaculaceae bacterium]|nr:hypothetical protein [Muribaculaceae bacterium]